MPFFLFTGGYWDALRRKVPPSQLVMCATLLPDVYVRLSKGGNPGRGARVLEEYELLRYSSNGQYGLTPEAQMALQRVIILDEPPPLTRDRYDYRIIYLGYPIV